MVTLRKSLYEREEKFSIYKAVYIYMLGGLAGTLWETFLNLIRGYGFAFFNGSIFTPFSFVYGASSVFIIFFLHKETNILKVYILGALGCGCMEYFLSFFEETFFGTRSWDYSNELLNLNGRTTVPFMAIWGFLCVALIFLVYRPFEKIYNRVPEKIAKRIAVAAAVIILADLVITLSAVLRYSFRYKGVKALTALGELIDKIFDDAFMRRRFPVVRFSG